MKKLLLLACTLYTATMFAQPSGTSINPNTQIKWAQATGSGAPSTSCSSANYGAPYTDITNNVSYVCGSGGWQLLSGNGSVTGQTPTCTALATSATALTKTAPFCVDDVNTPTKITSTVRVDTPGVNIKNGPLTEELPNNTASGATLNELVCMNGSAQAQTCTTVSANWTGVAVGGATGSTAGSVLVARTGQASIICDGTTVIGHYVTISSIFNGYCHDTGATTYPTTGAVIGRVLTVNSGSGTAATVNLYSPGIVANGGGGGSPGGSNQQFQGNCTGAFCGLTGITFDSATQGRVQSVASVPAVTPYADVRHPSYGAICNGTADDTVGIQAALTAAGGTGGSGTVFIPDGCHMANGSGLTSPNTALQITLNIQGTLKSDTTFVTPRGVDVVCLSKGPKPQFASGSPTCIVNVPNVYGTIGTAITSTNTAVTITPSFAGGTIANLPQNASIMLGGVETCTTTGATRTNLAGTYPGAGPVNVTYSIGTCTDSSGNTVAFGIPPAALTVVSSCSDATFNTPTGGIFSGAADFPGLTLSARMVGSAATLADTSCVVTGLNRDSIESTRIEAVSGPTITVRTNHVHAATDQFGMNGMAGTFNDLSHKLIKGVTVTGNMGAGYWADANTMIKFDGDSFQGYQYLTSIPMVLSSSWGWTFENSQTTSYSGYTCPTISFNCGNIGPPYDVLMDLLPQSIFSENAVNGGVWGPNSTVSVGMYMTASGYPAGYITGPVLNNSVIEQPMWNGITIDNRNTGAIWQTSIEDSLIQDNLVGWSRAAWIGYTDTSTSARRGTVAFYNNLNLAYSGVGNTPLTVNKYFCGEISVNGSSRYNNLVWPVCPEATVTINDGRAFVGEMNTGQMGISYIPYPTKPVTTDPSAWTCSTVTGSGCTVTTGKFAPDGSTTAGEFYGGTGFSQIQIASGTYSTAPGDVFLYGAWSRCTDSFGTGTMKMTTFGTDSFDTTNSNGFTPLAQNMFWHVTVGMSIVTVGQVGNHSIGFYLSPSDTATGTTCQFWQPFLIPVPASAGIPIDEIQRWRTEALHGYVPPNLSAGQVMALSPAIKLLWGQDVNLYRGTETATITNVLVSGGTATITAANHFYNGEWVTFSSVATNTWLNTNPPVQIATASSTQFTFATVHGNVSNADTGTATIGGLKTDLTMDMKGLKINGSYGTSGQFLQSIGNGSQWANSAASEPGNTYDFSPSAATGGISCTGTNPYTCTLPPICNMIRYDILSGGSGGGSGATATSAANGFGGGGGSAGEVQNGTVPCSYFGGPSATVVVTVGAGGNGGAANSGTSATGNNGVGGGSSKVAGPSGYGLIQSSAGAGATYGAGGSATAAAGGTQSPNLSNVGICGGNAGTAATPGAQTCQTGNSAAAGGSGGGGLTAGTAGSGGAQGTSSTAQSIRGATYTAGTVTGGVAGGSLNGQTPTYNTTALVLFLYSALGGTGGAASCTANGGDGGTGMEPGGGGGGGGAACNTFSSGKGGNGGPGHVRLTIE